MTMNRDNLARTISILTALGSLAIVGVRLYQIVASGKTKKAVDKKLDLALEHTMDCSDAVASY